MYLAYLLSRTLVILYSCESFFLNRQITYDPTSKYAFVADYSGQVTVLKLGPTGFELVTNLKGHQSKQKQ